MATHRRQSRLKRYDGIIAIYYKIFEELKIQQETHDFKESEETFPILYNNSK